MSVPPHTAHELRNLWDAYQFEVQALNHALANAWGAWSKADAAGFQQFNSDWATFSQAFSLFGEVVDRVLAPVVGASGDEDTTPAYDPENLTQGDQFDRLVALFVTGTPDGDPSATTYTTTSFNGLDARFRTGPAASFAPSYVGIPQPDAPDLGLSAYKFTDAAYTAIGNAAKQIATGITFGLLPALAAAGVVYLILRRR